LYIGNHLGASGRYEPLVAGHESPEFERADATMLAQQDLGRLLSPREVSHYWTNRTIDDIALDPWSWIVLMGCKTLLLINRYEVPDVESLYVYGTVSTPLALLTPFWHFGVLMPLAAIGIVSASWHRMTPRILLWLLATMAAAVVLFFILARYRYPLVPLLMPFAAYGLTQLWSALRGGQALPEKRLSRRRTLMLLAVGAIVAVGVNIPVQNEDGLHAHALMNVGVALAREGDVNGAVGYFEEAVRAFPPSAEARMNLAQAYAILGAYDRAIPHYQAAISIKPDLPGLNYNFGAALEHLGRQDEALEQFEQATKIDPSDEEAVRAVERIRGRRQPGTN